MPRGETLDAFMERVEDQPYPNSVKRVAWATGQEPSEIDRRIRTTK